MAELIKNQIAVVTGGTNGIGKAITKKFLEHGARVYIVGTSKDRGEKAVAELTKAIPGSFVHFFQGDVADGERAAQIIQEVLESEGRIDILVNNAGITRDQLLIRLTPEDWERVLEVNVKSCYNFCRAATKAMLKSRKGKIINMSSVIGLTGNAGQVNYAASKAAVVGFTKALAKEIGSRNIFVNCIAPGYIETEMTKTLSEDQKKVILDRIPMGRLGDPEDVANVALFLASDLSNYVTAQVMTVDGGLV